MKIMMEVEVDAVVCARCGLHAAPEVTGTVRDDAGVMRANGFKGLAGWGRLYPDGVGTPALDLCPADAAAARRFILQVGPA